MFGSIFKRPERPLFSILLPIHRPPHLLPFAVSSVLAQTDRRFELFILCDGAPAETVAAAEKLAKEDARIAVRAFPKGERHGEAHRDRVIREDSRGDMICQIADDDLWFPGFLEQMGRLLETTDFGNLIQVQVRPGDVYVPLCHDLAMPEIRERMLHRQFNFFGPTCCGYRRSAYDRLDTGWSPAPENIWTDLYMWRKFLACDGMTFATRHRLGALCFSTPHRQEWTPGQRAEESRRYLETIRDPASLDELCADIRKSQTIASSTLWLTEQQRAEQESAA
jgi:glycosyltransferase involved in cell wall biosynthesis